MGRPIRNHLLPETTENLLAAAEREFGRLGFAAARLEDIASAAQIRRSSLLYHFASKEALYQAVIKRVFTRLTEVFFEVMSTEGSFEERVSFLVSGYLRFLEEHPALPSLILREIVDAEGPGQEILQNEIAPLLDALEDFVRREGATSLPKNLPIRETVLQLGTSILVRYAATPALRHALWGEQDATLKIARAVLLGETHATSTDRPERRAQPRHCS